MAKTYIGTFDVEYDLNCDGWCGCDSRESCTLHSGVRSKKLLGGQVLLDDVMQSDDGEFDGYASIANTCAYGVNLIDNGEALEIYYVTC